MAVMVNTANAANSNDVKFWFDDFTPDVEITIPSEDSALGDKIMEYISKLVKKSVLKNIIEDVTPKVFEDYTVSKILNAYVYYISFGTKKYLINFVNKTCRLNLDPYALNFKLNIDDESIIFIESSYLGNPDIFHHRMYAQVGYCFKNHYLRNGKHRDPRKYAESVLLDGSMEEYLKNIPAVTNYRRIF